MKRFMQMMRLKEVRSKILYMVFALVIVRMMSQIPVPGVNHDIFKSLFGNTDEGALGFINAFTGGGLDNFSILALSITPYITASIIVQLLTIAFPALEEISKDGETGRKKMQKINRYLAVGLSVFQSGAMCIGFRNQLILELNVVNVIATISILTAGTCFLMWFADQITVKGVGNGTSAILLINILSRVPQDFITLYQNFIHGKSIALGLLAAVIILAVIIAVTVLTLTVDGAQRIIPVQYSQKMVGRRLVGSQGSSIPMKVNTAGVIPVIFASSIMSFPSIILMFLKKTPSGIPGRILRMLSSSSWFNPADPISSIGIVLYIVLIVFFAYFYTSITFNPTEMADNLRKGGGMVPGIRPGKPTENYLKNILKYIIFIGSTGLILVCIIPILFSGVFHAQVSFGGTSLIIITSVILDILKRLDSMMAVRNYRGFLG